VELRCVPLCDEVEERVKLQKCYISDMRGAEMPENHNILY